MPLKLLPVCTTFLIGKELYIAILIYNFLVFEFIFGVCEYISSITDYSPVSVCIARKRNKKQKITKAG